MLWSDLKPDDIPAPGQEVCYSHQSQRWIVTSRIRDEHKQVWLEIQSGNTRLWERIECLQWAPISGDICTIILRPYIEWVQARIDWERGLAEDEPLRYWAHLDKVEEIKKEMSLVDQAGSWLYQDLHLREIAHNWATVQAGGKGASRLLPTVCIAVLRPCSRVQQMEVAA